MKENKNRKWWVLVGATLLYLATTADGPNFNAALPTIQEYFQASVPQIQLLTSAAQLCVAAFVLAAGSLGDLYGRKRVFLLAGAGLVVSLLLQALSPSIAILSGMRALDGVFSAITTPLAVAMITTEFTGKQRGLALGIFTAAVGLGEAFLPLLAGRLTDLVGWRAVFSISLITGVLAYFLVRAYAREGRDPNARRLDVGGIVLSAIAMICIVGSFLLAGSLGFGDTRVWLVMLAGLVVLLVFVWWEGRTPNPALQLALFRKPMFLSTFIAGFGIFFVMMPIGQLMQIYFQTVLAFTALVASAALIPLYLGTTLSGPFAGKLEEKIGPRGAVTGGIGAMLVGLLLLTTLGSFPAYWILGLGLGLIAVGYGLANPTRVEALMSSASDDVAGAASSSNSVGVESGSAAGIALSTTFAVAFARGAFGDLGAKAGLSPGQVTEATRVLHDVMHQSVSTNNPAIAQPALDQLIEGARTAFATGIAQTMLVMVAILVICILVVWIGMRPGPAAAPSRSPKPKHAPSLSPESD